MPQTGLKQNFNAISVDFSLCLEILENADYFMKEQHQRQSTYQSRKLKINTKVVDFVVVSMSPDHWHTFIAPESELVDTRDNHA